MTTIRKIPTSKINGDNANSTSTNEIRPFGELAVYTKNDASTGDVNKLELLMFDGVRTNLRSKVLAKGTFYGGDANSGDGYANDTIKLIPDAELHYNEGSYGNDQYLIIDPTSPNHIHIRAGGPQDDSNATLILGGELSNITIDDQADAHVSIFSRTADNSTSHVWQFNNDGKLNFPGGSNSQSYTNSNGNLIIATGTSGTAWAGSLFHSTVKLIIQAEYLLDEIYQVQSCEVLLVRSSGTVENHVTYGNVYTHDELFTVTSSVDSESGNTVLEVENLTAGNLYISTFATTLGSRG